MKPTKKLSDIMPMNDEKLEKFWEKNEPEEFEERREGNLKFGRPPKKLTQLLLEPGDVRIIDRVSKHSGIHRAQLFRPWVKEKIRNIEKQENQ